MRLPALFACIAALYGVFAVYSQIQAQEKNTYFGVMAVPHSSVKPLVLASPAEYAGSYNSDSDPEGTVFTIGSRNGALTAYYQEYCGTCDPNSDSPWYPYREILPLKLTNGRLQGTIRAPKGKTPQKIDYAFYLASTSDGTFYGLGDITADISLHRKNVFNSPEQGIITASASSTLLEAGRELVLHDVAFLFDNDRTTAWVEGTKGFGAGEWVQVDFTKQRLVRTMIIHAGFGKSEKIFTANNRPRTVRLTYSDSTTELLEINDINAEQRIALRRTIPTSWVRVEILDVYKGTKYDDTCISELTFE